MVCIFHHWKDGNMLWAIVEVRTSLGIIVIVSLQTLLNREFLMYKTFVSFCLIMNHIYWMLEDDSDHMLPLSHLKRQYVLKLLLMHYHRAAEWFWHQLPPYMSHFYKKKRAIHSTHVTGPLYCMIFSAADQTYFIVFAGEYGL